MINYEKIQQSKIFSDSEYVLYGIKVPNYVIGAYYSKGWFFVNQHNISVESGLCFILYWFILSCEIEIKDERVLGYRNDLISKFHRLEGNAGDTDVFRLTPLQNIILNCREDLKKIYVEDGFKVDFQKWWVSYGAEEYNMPMYPLWNRNEIAGLADSYVRELYVDVMCKEKYHDDVNKQARDGLRQEVAKNWLKFNVNVRA